MRLTIVIPVYISNELHLDFTRQTLDSIQTSYDYQALIINNFCAPQYTQALEELATSNSQIINNSKGNILAASWNLGIKYAFEGWCRDPRICARSETGLTGSSSTHNSDPEPSKTSDYCLILNNDIILHPQCLDNLVAFGKKHSEFLLWSASEWPNSRTLAKAKLTPSFSLHPHFSCFMVSPKTTEVVGDFDEHFNMGYFEDNDYHTRILKEGYQAAATDSAKFYHYGSRTINVDDNLKIEGKYHYQKNRQYFKKKWGVDIHGRAFDPPEKILKEIRPNLSNHS